MSTALINKVKKLNTEKLIEFLSEEIHLDDDGLDIIREKKISGRAFIKLTEDKLEEWGVADGSVTAIADFIEELRDEKYEPSSKRRKVEDVEGEEMKLPLTTRSLEQNKVTVQTPSLWTESLNSYIDNVLKKSGDEFKMEVMRKIEGDEGNEFRLYCEKILIDFYNLVDVFPNLSRKIGVRKYIVQNISSLFKFYESTFGNLYFDWIETHSPAPKLTNSRTYSGVVKVDAKGVRVFDDKEIFHAEVSGPPSSSSSHAVNDTTKSIRTDILNLIAILLDHLRAPVEDATKIKVFSLHAIEYRITLYSLNMSKNGTYLISELYSTLLPFSFDAISKYKGILYMMAIFHEEVTKQISIMKNLDLTVDHNEGNTVRDVLKFPKSLKELPY